MFIFKSSGFYVLQLKLAGYPGVNFENQGVYLTATNYKDALAEIKSNDTVTLMVKRHDFEKYVLNNSLLSPLENLGKPSYYEFYSLKFKGKEYVENLSEAKKKVHKENRIAFAVFGGICLLFGVREILRKSV